MVETGMKDVFVTGNNFKILLWILIDLGGKEISSRVKLSVIIDMENLGSD
jgi:hypothetical protein